MALSPLSLLLPLLLLHAAGGAAWDEYPTVNMTWPPTRNASYGGVDNPASFPCGGRDALPDSSTIRTPWPLDGMGVEKATAFNRTVDDPRNITYTTALMLGVFDDDLSPSGARVFVWSNIQSPKESDVTNPHNASSSCTYPGVYASYILSQIYSSADLDELNGVNATIRMDVDIYEDDIIVESSHQCGDIVFVSIDQVPLLADHECYWGRAPSATTGTGALPPGATGSSSTTSTNLPNPARSHYNPTAVIAGAVVGSVVGLSLVVAGLVLWRRQPRASQPAEEATELGAATSGGRPMEEPRAPPPPPWEELPTYEEAIKTNTRDTGPPAGSPRETVMREIPLDDLSSPNENAR